MPWGGICGERIFVGGGKGQSRGERKAIFEEKSAKSNGKGGGWLKKTENFSNFFSKTYCKTEKSVV